jgi:hypothetical protein
VIVYVSIGNSDDKLAQAEWSGYASRVRAECRNYAIKVHGEWYSASSGAWQNACFCLELTEHLVGMLRQALIEARQEFRQDSVAWAVAETEFL